ncbi:exonuclease SbcCD subunit D [Clostridium carnis]
MKIIHTGDWHIGKIVNDFSMIDDQIHILGKLKELIINEKPDVLIIAGDIYDRSIAPVEAVELLNSFFSEVVLNLKINVLAIAGNHDSGERIDFGSGLFEKQGLYMEGTLKEEVKKVTIKDKDGNVNFYLLPYVHPSQVRKYYNNNEIKDHNDAMKFLVGKIEEKINKEDRNILITHGYVTMNREKALDAEEKIYEAADLEASESERPLSIGGTDLIDGNIFSSFDYVALGHLHGKQKVGSDKIRYSGSLLKYSFSEINHKKGVTIVNIDSERNLDINHIELKAKRDLRTIIGPIDELIKAGYDEKAGRVDYIQAILTDEGELIDPIQKLRSVYPNVMLLKRENIKGKNDSLNSVAHGHRNKSKLELFTEYYEAMGAGEFSEVKRDLIKSIIDETINGEVKK